MNLVPLLTEKLLASTVPLLIKVLPVLLMLKLEVIVPLLQRVLPEPFQLMFLVNTTPAAIQTVSLEPMVISFAFELIVLLHVPH
ncbi:hypothetical protein BXP70_22345 [Hymenobacter crusticola]|uniref:Uncharacterized protein n=1 Tax=Hymenobacter crusticola TaxID=1770526 RepID=A0A243W8H4_9BACT|nr:hypothetical protein BXP70_22345 [Hymenobacter crusticola]